MSEGPSRYFGGIFLFDWVRSTGMEPGELSGASEQQVISTQASANSLLTACLQGLFVNIFMLFSLPGT